MYQQQVGKLQVGTTKPGGKVVTEWRYSSPIKNGPKMEVQVAIDMSKNDSIVFRAKGSCLPAPIEDTDIERLRQKVEASLQLQQDLLTGIKWEDWLEIEVRGKTSTRAFDNEKRAELEIIYRPLKRGVHPITGAAYTIITSGIAIPFPLPKKAGEVDVGEDVELGDERFRGFHKRDLDAEYSYIQATPENVAALGDLVGRMEALKDKLAEFLRHDIVQESLADINNRLPLLPAP